MTHVGAIAESYLKYMLIASQVGDHSAPFRDFLDNWYAFERGQPFLTAGSRPRWFNNPCAWSHRDMLAAMHFKSEVAQRILHQGLTDRATHLALRRSKDTSVRLMVDHAIPIRILRERIFADPLLRTLETLREFLRANYCLGVITAVEDAKLNGLGLRNTMPSDWDGADPYARYRTAGISPINS